MQSAADDLIQTSREGDTLIVAALGRWVVAGAQALDVRLRGLEGETAHAVTFDFRRLEAIDSAGGWLLLRTRRALLGRGTEVAIRNLDPAFEPLLRQVEASHVQPLPHPRRPHRGLVGLLERIGSGTFRFLRKGRNLLGFFGLVVLAILGVMRHPRRLRVAATVVQIERTGADAVPIVGLLSFLIGIVFAYQGADQLRRFGAEIYTVNMLGIAILRELGVMLTAVIVAGRSGSSFAAQIGTMKVNEEVDAMRTLGLDPIEVLVLPRLFAMILTLPLLAVFANAMGLFGGAMMTWATLDVGFPGFLHQLRSFLPGWSFWIGVLKAPFFATAIALVGCYEGLRAEGSAESVGRLTTQSVVEAIFLVIVLDAAFSIVFSKLGI